MRTLQVICFALAATVAIGLQWETSSYAKNLELQNQSKVTAHCFGAGNCRFGDNTTSRPTSTGPNRSAIGGLHAKAASHAGVGGHARPGGGGSGGHAGSRR
jgi:hypothetical protein